MNDICSVDDSGKILIRYSDKRKPVVNGEVKYPQSAVRMWSDQERKDNNFAFVSVEQKPAYNPDTHKLLKIKAGVGDALVDTWDVVPLTVEEQKTNAKLELSITDYKLARVTEEVVDVLLAKNLLLSSDLAETVKTLLAKRKQLRHTL